VDTDELLVLEAWERRQPYKARFHLLARQLSWP